MNAPKIIKIQPYQKPTTGYKECDRDIDHAVDSALIRIKPLLRDILRDELKRHLALEEVSPEPTTSAAQSQNGHKNGGIK
jgi:hypothetical protein